MTQVWYHPEKDCCVVIEFDPGFRMLGLDRYQFDDGTDEMWLDGKPSDQGLVWVCDL